MNLDEILDIYVPFLCRAAEIITYPRPTAKPNASGIKTTPPSKFKDCWIMASNIALVTYVTTGLKYCLTMLTRFRYIRF